MAGFVVLAPFLAVLVFWLLRGRHLAFPIAVVATLLLGTVYATRSGVQQTCTINEAECIGATATVYLIAALWCLAITVVTAIFFRYR